MHLTAYLLLLLGIIPFVLLLWFYTASVHSARRRIWSSLNKLSLPNKIGTISLVIAILAFLYSILYSSISTYYSLKAIESADSAGIEQKAAFNKQMDLMIAQQKVLESTKQSLAVSTKLAQSQVDNLKTSVNALGKMVETSTKQLAILNEQRNEQLRIRQLKPDFEIRFALNDNNLGLTQEDLQKNLISLKPNTNNILNISINVINRGNAPARNLLMNGMVLPENVQIFEIGSQPNPIIPNRVSSPYYLNYPLPPGSSLQYQFAMKVPTDLNRLLLAFRIGTDDPTRFKQFKAEFLIDRSNSKAQ